MKISKYIIKSNFLYKDKIIQNIIKEYYFKPLKTGSYEFICYNSVELNAEIYNLETDKITNSAYQKNMKNFKLASTLLEGVVYCIKVYTNEIIERNRLVEYSFKLREASYPLNSYFKYQWGIFNVKTGIDINILSVWRYIYETDLKIGIVDSGIKWDHPNLKKTINKKLCYNFLSQKNECYSNEEKENFKRGHGTFVAGIISSQSQNRVGIIGVSHNKNIISLKIFGELKRKQEEKKFNKISDNFILAIKYAMEKDIKILNCSFSGRKLNLKERSLIKKAKNILFIVSAGNENLNLDEKKCIRHVII